MSIPVVCENCASSFTASDEAAGRRSKCPKCKNPLVVPGARRAVATAKPVATEAMAPIEEQATGSQVGPRPVTPRGRSGLRRFLELAGAVCVGAIVAGLVMFGLWKWDQQRTTKEAEAKLEEFRKHVSSANLRKRMKATSTGPGRLVSRKRSTT